MPKVSAAHRAARRQQVLDAAAACFARQGFHRTTMQDIVHEAGLSPGAVYGYFASKDDIIEASAAERHAEERDLIRRAAADGDAAKILRQLAHHFLGALGKPGERDRRRMGVQIWAEALRNPRLLRLVRRGIDEPLRLLTQVIRESQARGETSRELDPEATARLTIAVFHGLVLQQSWDPRVDVSRYLALTDHLLDALVRPPGRRRRAAPRSPTRASRSSSRRPA